MLSGKDKLFSCHKSTRAPTLDERTFRTSANLEKVHEWKAVVFDYDDGKKTRSICMYMNGHKHTKKNG